MVGKFISPRKSLSFFPGVRFRFIDPRRSFLVLCRMIYDRTHKATVHTATGTSSIDTNDELSVAVEDGILLVVVDGVLVYTFVLVSGSEQTKPKKTKQTPPTSPADHISGGR